MNQRNLISFIWFLLNIAITVEVISYLQNITLQHKTFSNASNMTNNIFVSFFYF